MGRVLPAHGLRYTLGTLCRGVQPLCGCSAPGTWPVIRTVQLANCLASQAVWRCCVLLTTHWDATAFALFRGSATACSHVGYVPLGPSVCLGGELVINGSPYRALLAVQGYMDRFTYLPGGGDQVYHRSHRARGAEVDEAILQCAGLLLGQLPVQGAPPTWRLETLARLASWPGTVTATVNRGRCLGGV